MSNHSSTSEAQQEPQILSCKARLQVGLTTCPTHHAGLLKFSGAQGAKQQLWGWQRPEANERCTLALLHCMLSTLHAQCMITWHVHHITWPSFYMLITLYVRPFAWSLAPHLACSSPCMLIILHPHCIALSPPCMLVALHNHHVQCVAWSSPRVLSPPCTLTAWHTRPLAHPSLLIHFSPSTFLGVTQGRATPRAPLGGKNLGRTEQQLLHCSHGVCMVQAPRP